MSRELLKKPAPVVQREPEKPKSQAAIKTKTRVIAQTPKQVQRATAKLEQNRSALQLQTERAVVQREAREQLAEESRVQRGATQAIEAANQAQIQRAQEVRARQQAFFSGFNKPPTQRKSLENVKTSGMTASKTRDQYQAAIQPEIVQRLINDSMTASIQASRATQQQNTLTTRADWFNADLPVLRVQHNHPDTPFSDTSSVFKSTDQQAFSLGNTYKVQRLASGLTPQDAANALMSIQRKADRDIALQGLLTGVNPRQSDYSSIQRLVAAGEYDLELQRQALLENADLQARALQLAKDEANPTTPNSGISEKIKAKLGGGSPLPENVRHQLEAGLNTNLESVRVHTDGEADKLAKSVNAIAFTTGKDIFFSSGSYNPNTKTGYELIAHEVTHTIQQASGQVSPGIDKDQTLETKAQESGAKLSGKFDPSFDPNAKPKAGSSFKNLENGSQANSPLLSNQPVIHRLRLEAMQRSSLMVQRKELSEPSGKTKDLNNLLFSANLTGTEDNRRIDFTLDRTANKITGSFAIHGTGRGNITKGEFDPADKTSPLRLEVVFTEGELKGKTRVLDGWFLYAESGTKKDENNDGKDDSSKSALPLLIGGVWKGGTKEYKLEPISPTLTAAKSGLSADKALEQAIINELPKAMMLSKDSNHQKNIKPENATLYVPMILKECKRAGITDPRQIAYICVTASWESLLGGDMDEGSSGSVAEQNYFNRTYANRNGNGDYASGDGYHYRGRGFVQLTGRARYKQASDKAKELDFKIDDVHPDLVANPELAATNKPLAAIILVWGMKEGWFTNVGFSGATYKNSVHTNEKMNPGGKLDFNEARWIVNGNDTASKAPMAQSAEYLTKAIETTGKTPDEGDLTRVSDKEYNVIRSMESKGLDKDEQGRISAGVEIGSLDGVKGYYNGPDFSKDWGRNSVDKYDTGLKWQCVEYVRRYYYVHFGMKIGAGRHGKDFDAGGKDGKGAFDGLVRYDYQGDATKADNLKDGLSVKPQHGDIFCMGQGTYGHVAIIASVTDTSVTIAQQNMVDEGFTYDLKLTQQKNGRWKLWYQGRSVGCILRKP
jgi:hypothetical protein